MQKKLKTRNVVDSCFKELKTVDPVKIIPDGKNKLEYVLMDKIQNYEEGNAFVEEEKFDWAPSEEIQKSE